jgi:hypothetical protein
MKGTKIHYNDGLTIVKQLDCEDRINHKQENVPST